MELKKVDYRQMEQGEVSGHSIMNDKSMSILSDVEVDVTVKLGSVRLTIADLYTLKAGSVVELDTHIDSEVEVQLSGNTIATGILSVVNDSYAVEITNAHTQQDLSDAD